MYLKKVIVNNFRKFGNVDNKAGLIVNLHKGLNVIVGENDSGKTAIIDAIKLLLGTLSDDFDRIQEEDFFCPHNGESSDSFFIEGILTELTETEAGMFLEWLSFDEDGKYELRLFLEVNKKKNDNGQDFIERRLLAGAKNCESKLDIKAKSLLKATYLKPLRDANTELRPGFRSRLAQILKAHSSFRDIDGEQHKLEVIVGEANEKVENYFSEEYSDGKSIKSEIESILSDFHDRKDSEKANTDFSITPANLNSILNKLSLNTNSINLGLGNMNLLFIATELLLLENSIVSNSIGPKITLIEELEAHLHTQAQIRLVKYLEKIVNDNKGSQFILTSHSTNLVSSISPESLIYLNENTAHSLSQEYTMLENEDYKFLERFLDSTKSNLFFAKGLILVEGDSELLLLPAIAELIDIPLHKYGISLINIGGTSFKRYIKLFSTQNEKCINLPISLVTDIDVRPKIYFKEENKEVYQINSKNRIEVEKIIDKNIEMTQVKIDDIYTRYTDMIKDLEINADNVKKELVSLTKQVIDDIKIKEEINEKRKKLVGKYSKYNANIEMCISPEWTLEYCLLFSPLQSLMKDAIFEAQYKTPFGAVTQSKIVDIESKLSIDETKEIAIYNLFKRLNEKKVSKAIVAQILANKILDLDKKEKEKLKSELLKDIYSRYLINSIYHASGLNLIKEEVNE